MSTEQPKNFRIVAVTGPVDAAFLQQANAVLAAAQEADGKPPVSEQSVISLRTRGGESETVRTFAAYQDSDEVLLGFAVIVDSPRGGVLEVAVHPEHRGIGVATALITEIASVREGSLSGLSAWAHGSHKSASEIAQHFDFVPVRELWRMRREVTEAPDETLAGASEPAEATKLPASAKLPNGVTIRSFVPGQDEEDWLEANRTAFAHHPEQGNMTRADLDARMAEEWFDPQGFFLAVNNDGSLLGFHWTKVHPATTSASAMGEVYVVGVTPKAQGMGVGKAVTAAGIEHLSALGLPAIMLYVDADNTAAVALYQQLGFTRWDMDVMYRPQAEI